MRGGVPLRLLAAVLAAGVLALAACASGAPRASSPAAAEPAVTEEPEQGGSLRGILVQRHGLTVNLPGSDDTPLAHHLPELLFLASRGFWGEAQECTANELPAVEKTAADDAPTSGCRVRFFCRPFTPAAGQNAWPHGDVILYLDQGTAEDAFLAIQSPTAPERWRRVRMAGYGPWLCKEVEMLTRTATGL
ncbi:MAG: hypothetical protein QMC81_01800 [Thermoanaerobacterales bacterium]|nr:hypothetical protein [Thermoanaerobacterales bacterium]